MTLLYIGRASGTGWVTRSRVFLRGSHQHAAHPAHLDDQCLVQPVHAGRVALAVEAQPFYIVFLEAFWINRTEKTNAI